MCWWRIAAGVRMRRRAVGGIVGEDVAVGGGVDIGVSGAGLWSESSPL